MKSIDTTLFPSTTKTNQVFLIGVSKLQVQLKSIKTCKQDIAVYLWVLSVITRASSATHSWHFTIHAMHSHRMGFALKQLFVFIISCYETEKVNSPSHWVQTRFTEEQWIKTKQELRKHVVFASAKSWSDLREDKGLFKGLVAKVFRKYHNWCAQVYPTRQWDS